MLCYFMLSYDVSLSLWNTSGFPIEKRVTLRRTVKETEYDWFYQVEAQEHKKGKLVLANTMAQMVTKWNPRANIPVCDKIDRNSFEL